MFMQKIALKELRIILSDGDGICFSPFFFESLMCYFYSKIEHLFRWHVYRNFVGRHF